MPRCRLCMDNCPVKAIDLSVDPVVFRKGCISCYFCEMLCPTGSIQVDAADGNDTLTVDYSGAGGFFDKDIEYPVAWVCVAAVVFSPVQENVVVSVGDIEVEGHGLVPRCGST